MVIATFGAAIPCCGPVRPCYCGRFCDVVADSSLPPAPIYRDLQGARCSSDLRLERTRSPAALQAIEQGRYENYNPKDFAKFSVIVSNSIKPSTSGPESRISVSGSPLNREDASALSELSELPILLTISPATSDGMGFPGGLKFARKLSRDSFSNPLIVQPTEGLFPIEAVFEAKVVRSEFRLFSKRLRLLVPGTRS